MQCAAFSYLQLLPGLMLLAFPARQTWPSCSQNHHHPSRMLAVVLLAAALVEVLEHLGNMSAVHLFPLLRQQPGSARSART